jgi:hypothetical protein
MALTAIEPVPFTVTFCPAAVVIVKPDPDTLSTVPAAPPAAGPDRALDPPPEPGVPGPAVADGDVAVVDEEMPSQAESAGTAHINTTATIHPLLLLDSNRPARG